MDKISLKKNTLSKSNGLIQISIYIHSMCQVRFFSIVISSPVALSDWQFHLVIRKWSTINKTESTLLTHNILWRSELQNNKQIEMATDLF